MREEQEDLHSMETTATFATAEQNNDAQEMRDDSWHCEDPAPA